jgi:hypothetical protein
MSFFHDFFTRFNSIVRAIVGFILPIAESNAGQLISNLLPIAQSIVADLANQQIPSAQKRDAAVSQLQDAAVKAGWSTASDIASSTLNLVVEMAVNHLNATAPAKS